MLDRRCRQNALIRAGARSARDKRGDDGGLAVAAYGETGEQGEHRTQHLVGELGRGDADGRGEVVGVDGDLHHPHHQEVVAAQRPTLPRDQDGSIGRGVGQEHAQPVAGLDHPGEQCFGSGFGVGVAAGADVDALLVVDGRPDPGDPLVVLVEGDRCELARLCLDQVDARKRLAGQVSREAAHAPLGQRARLVPRRGYLGAGQQVGNGVDGGEEGISRGTHAASLAPRADTKERPGCRTCATVRSVVGDARQERFEAVARTILEPLRRYLARRTDPATADDVLAETLLVCWRRLDDLPDDPLPWSYGVARNCLANAQRGVRRQQRLASKIAVVDPPADSVQGPGESQGRDLDIDRALRALREEDAELLRLWAWEQLTPAEIAEVLGITPNAASIRLHRAREKLKEELRKTSEATGHEETNERRRT